MQKVACKAHSGSGCGKSLRDGKSARGSATVAVDDEETADEGGEEEDSPATLAIISR